MRFSVYIDVIDEKDYFRVACRGCQKILVQVTKDAMQGLGFDARRWTVETAVNHCSSCPFCTGH